MHPVTSAAAFLAEVMTIPELLGDEALRQTEFPVTRASVYLAHAGVCPLPRRVAEAVSAGAVAGTGGDQETAVPRDFLAGTRALGARLLSCTPAEVALVGPTSLGLSFVAAGLPFETGDEILVYFDDYPSNVYPWLALEARGVRVRRLESSVLGRLEVEDVLTQVTSQTRLVALASCHFIAGWRLDYARLGRELRARGVWFCLDAIQTLGAFPMDVTYVDFLAADAHKWLLGPCAAGLLYVRKALHEVLSPVVFGWHNVRCPDFVASAEMQLRPDARRYEAGSANLLGTIGLRASLELMLEVGTDAIARELLRKRDWIVPALEAQGFDVLGAEAPADRASGITSFYRPGRDMTAVHQRLEAAGVVTSLRKSRDGQNYIRISPHFYNTDAELERLIAALARE